jgi:hypothetical protein
MDNLDQLASKVFAILGEAGIPAEIIGGYALSHYGYVRNTVDIDIIVRDHVAAVETLKAHGFTEAKHWFMLQDPSLPGVKVDVLPGGRTISGNTQANPMPSSVSDVPAFISLQDLVRLKLGVVVYNGGVYRVQKKNEADVAYLISNNNLPRTFMSGCSDETIRFEYEEIWDRNSAPRKESALDPFADFFKVEED